MRAGLAFLLCVVAGCSEGRKQIRFSDLQEAYASGRELRCERDLYGKTRTYYIARGNLRVEGREGIGEKGILGNTAVIKSDGSYLMRIGENAYLSNRLFPGHEKETAEHREYEFKRDRETADSLRIQGRQPMLECTEQPLPDSLFNPENVLP